MNIQSALPSTRSASQPMIVLSESHFITIQGAARDADGKEGRAFMRSANNGNLEDVLEWTSTPSVTLSGATPPQAFKARANASQQASVGAAKFTLEGALEATHEANPDGVLQASARSYFAVTFRVEAVVNGVLELHYDTARGHGNTTQLDKPIFSFVAVGGVVLLTLDSLQQSMGHGKWTYNAPVGLEPGDYKLVLEASANVAGDPLGDFAKTTFSLSFTAKA